MSAHLRGDTVLITGGTGSFGHAMTRRLLDGRCGQIRVLSRDEAKQDEMRRTFGDDRLRFYVGDVRDPASVDSACRGADYVFHAAALKQVPSCEFFPLEAVRTNVLGSANVIEAAHANAVRTVVCLSTDKAVYPVNAMGTSKALMEKVAQAYTRNGQSGDTVVCAVRYGNVLHSRGSVVPLFIEQLRQGRPLTLTDPDMTRFLMSLDEATRLVEHAFRAAVPGDLFVRKAPASTIGVLAKAVAQLFGTDPGLRIIGTRHGEKLYETLVSREEMARAEDQGDYFRIPLDGRGLDYDLYFEEGDRRVEAVDEYTSHNTQRLDEGAVREVLLEIPQIRAQLADRLIDSVEAAV
ncbi:MAG: polysaccharide biosynthesis protein [Carbonactinosporaceae bacterium]